jgi:hypothetical protein
MKDVVQTLRVLVSLALGISCTLGNSRNLTNLETLCSLGFSRVEISILPKNIIHKVDVLTSVCDSVPERWMSWIRNTLDFFFFLESYM